MAFIKWYRSKTALAIILVVVGALIGALCAYYLAYPLNLITTIACCVPSGIVIRKAAIRAMLKREK